MEVYQVDFESYSDEQLLRVIEYELDISQSDSVTIRKTELRRLVAMCRNIKHKKSKKHGV